MPIFTKAYNLKHIGIQGYNYIVVSRIYSKYVGIY